MHSFAPRLPVSQNSVKTLTSSKHWPATVCCATPEIAMQDTGSRQLQSKVQCFLELVVDSRRHNGRVQGTTHHGVCVVGLVKTAVSGTGTCAHPRRSKKRQMTLATTSSFFSSGRAVTFGCCRVRFAYSSEAVATRQSLISIVED